MEELIAFFKSLFNDFEAYNKLIDRIIAKIDIIEELGNGIVIALMNEDDLNIGKGIVKVLKITLDFYVN